MDMVLVKLLALMLSEDGNWMIVSGPLRRDSGVGCGQMLPETGPGQSVWSYE